MLKRLFRSRRLRALFPAGVAAAFIVGLILAARQYGDNLPRLFIGTLVVAAVISAGLYIFLKFFVEPRIRHRR